MLGQFGAIVDEIVRGARELHGAMVAARKELAPLVTRLRQPPSGGSVETGNLPATPVEAGRRPAREGGLSAYLLVSTLSSLARRLGGRGSEQEARSREHGARGRELRAESVESGSPPSALRSLLPALSRAPRPSVAPTPPTPPPAAPRPSVAPTPPTPPPAAPAVLDLDRFAAQNARAISQALQRKQYGAAAQPAARTVSQIRAGRLPASTRAGRRAPPPASWLQRYLRRPELRHRIRAMQAAGSPLRRYVGTALRQYSEGGNLRQFFRTLRLAPRAMAQPAAQQAAAQAGISAGQLARGAALAGLAGRAGGAALGAASTLAGPVGLAAGAVVGLVAGFLKLNAALQNTVLRVEQFARSLAAVHPGMARLSMEAEIRQLREQQRVASGTYATTRLAHDTTAQFRRETEEFRILIKNLVNLGIVFTIWVIRIAKLVTPIGVLVQGVEKLSGPLNKAISKYLGKEEKEIEVPWLKWLEAMGNPKQRLPRRTRPEQPFNRGPKPKA